MPDMKYTLYRGEDIQLTFLPSLKKGDKRFIITFNYAKPEREAARSDTFDSGFAENVFCPEGINELHVVPIDNNWYQSNEMVEVIARINSIIRTRVCIICIWNKYGGIWCC